MSRMTRLSTMAMAWLAVGCAGSGSQSTGSTSLLGAPGQLWSKRVATNSDAWTILCLEATDMGRRENTEALAKGMRVRPELSADAVRVEHDATVSRIYYGTYYQRPDRRTGQYKLDPICARTTRFIRSLSLGGVSPFLMARPVPMTVTRNDPPEWDLRNAPGVYSLQICYCITKPDFPDRRDGAVEIVRQLRKEGEQAYYYHGPSKSLVCVGSFDESAIMEDPRRGSRQYSSEVIRYQSRREEFKYNTEWLQKVYTRRGGGPRLPEPSFLVPIPRDAEQEWAQ